MKRQDIIVKFNNDQKFNDRIIKLTDAPIF